MLWKVIDTTSLGNEGVRVDVELRNDDGTYAMPVADPNVPGGVYHPPLVVVIPRGVSDADASALITERALQAVAANQQRNADVAAFGALAGTA